MLAGEAASPTARVTNIARLAPFDVVIAPPDAKMGHDYAYRVLSLKSEGGDPDSLNAARYIPQLRVCPLYSDAPEDPAKAAAEGRPPPNPQPTATRVAKNPTSTVERPVYDVALYLEAALKSQVTTVSSIAVVPALCHKCTVHSSLPLFAAGSTAEAGAAKPNRAAADRARTRLRMNSLHEGSKTRLCRCGVFAT